MSALRCVLLCSGVWHAKNELAEVVAHESAVQAASQKCALACFSQNESKKNLKGCRQCLLVLVGQTCFSTPLAMLVL